MMLVNTLILPFTFQVYHTIFITAPTLTAAHNLSFFFLSPSVCSVISSSLAAAGSPVEAVSPLLGVFCYSLALLCSALHKKQLRGGNALRVEASNI
jgi:hypothetical protein